MTRGSGSGALNYLPARHHQPATAHRGAANPLKLGQLSGDSGPGRTCCRLAAVAFDPQRSLGEDKFASARGTTGSDLVGSGKVGAQQCTGRSHRGESEMRRAVLICAVLAALSPTYAEAAERIW